MPIEPTDLLPEECDDNSLATIAEKMAAEGAKLLRMAGIARQELIHRLQERGATHLETDSWSGVLVPTGYAHEIDMEKMLALREHVPAEVWERVYVQQPQPPIPAYRWDHRVLNELVKLGGDVRAIIEGARISPRGEPKLDLTKKKGGTTMTCPYCGSLNVSEVHIKTCSVEAGR